MLQQGKEAVFALDWQTVYNGKRPMRSKILIASLILLCVNVPAFADDATQRRLNSLRGLQGVSIAVELSPNIKQRGLTVEQIQTDTEIKLRIAGIRVIPTHEELFKEPGAQTLFIGISASYEPGLRGFAVNVEVTLHQLVILRRDPTSMMYAGTWTDDVVAFVPENRVQELRDTVKDRVDKFINAYLTANPKK